MNCCDVYGNCSQSDECPNRTGIITPAQRAYLARAAATNKATAPRTCEAMGICQHPERECPGACEQPPRVPFWTEDNAPALLEETLWYAVVVGGMGVLSLAVLMGAGLYIWARWLA